MPVVATSTIRDHIAEVLDEADESVKTIYLYGSQARGDADEESDIDIALVDPMFEGTTMSERGIWFKKNWDYLDVGPLELLCFTPEEFEMRLDSENDSAVKDIGEEGITLFDSDGDVSSE